MVDAKTTLSYFLGSTSFGIIIVELLYKHILELFSFILRPYRAYLGIPIYVGPRN